MADLQEFHDLSSVQATWDEGLLILMYHAIETPSVDYDLQMLYVDPGTLREQLSELKAAGAEFIRASDLKSARKGRQVMVTIDDGFENVFVNALPIFQELGVPAIEYIVAGQIGGTNLWDHQKRLQKRPLMSREQILEWVQVGHEIGAHTVNHPNLAEIPLAEARREIFDSKKILEDLLGRPVVHFCYPYGGWNPRVRDLVEEAGFETATSCIGGYNTPATDRLGLRRLAACHEDPYAAARKLRR